MIDEDIDVFVFCATRREHDELSTLLDGVTRHSRRELVFDREYLVREIAVAGCAVVVCTSCIGEIGRLPAAIAARDLLYHFRRTPRDIILCGIAAAHPDSGYHLGDIVVPAHIVDYAEQKHTKEEIQIRARDYALDGNRLFRLAKALSATSWHEKIDPSIRRDIERNIKGLRWPPRCHVDLSLACGDYVLDDKLTVKKILGKLSSTRKYMAWAVEMESTAIARSLSSVLSDGSQLTVIKSISDFAFEKTETAQPGAQLIAAAFVRELLVGMAKQKSPARGLADLAPKKIMASLRASPEVVHMLRKFPPNLAARWRQTSIDGAIEIFSCAQATNKYGGYRRDQILCEVLDAEWPHDFGGLDEYQQSNLEAGISGSMDGSVEGWLKTMRGTPNRIRVLLEPPMPTVLDRGTLGLKFGNSDYFTVRTITELARRDYRGLEPSFDKMFPERWAEPERQFSQHCVPYHVSAQGVLIARPASTPDARYLLLASVNTANRSITAGWGATMAEQMWAPGRTRHEDPWWQAALAERKLTYRASETRVGDEHVNETLARGLREEFQIDVEKGDCWQEPLLLNVAIEQDMYFVTFIYFVEVRLSIDEVYRRWKSAPDSQEMGLLAAYQLTGHDRDGNTLNGPHRLAQLMADDEFDPGPYLLPVSIEQGRLHGSWHVSSRLRMYACGMHLWPREFERLVHMET